MMTHVHIYIISLSLYVYIYIHMSQHHVDCMTSGSQPGYRFVLRCRSVCMDQLNLCSLRTSVEQFRIRIGW